MCTHCHPQAQQCNTLILSIEKVIKCSFHAWQHPDTRSGLRHFTSEQVNQRWKADSRNVSAFSKKRCCFTVTPVKPTNWSQCNLRLQNVYIFYGGIILVNVTGALETGSSWKLQPVVWEWFVGSLHFWLTLSFLVTVGMYLNQPN